MYTLYFLLLSSFPDSHRACVIVDIDNTVNDQATRLLRYTEDDRCDFARANSVRELLREAPLPGSAEFVSALSVLYRIVWLTSRGMRLMGVSYYWLWSNGFPIHGLVCTGSTLRKIEFLRYFARRHIVAFVVDDMKEGYEQGTPRLVLPYAKYLEANGIAFFEDLAAAKAKCANGRGEEDNG